MRGRFYLYDEIQKLAANLINLEGAIKVSSPNLGIDFALSNERGIHPVLTDHRIGCGLCSREVQSVEEVHDAPQR